MRILVTGGAGFIGSHVVDECIAAGHDVAVVDNFWEHGGGRRSNLNPKAKLHEMDIRAKDIHQVVRSFRPDVVSHHAAQHSVAISTADPDYDADVNVRGLINVLEACAVSGVKKVVFASSAATYGTPQYLPINEKHPQMPESPYGITKMAAEHYLRYYAASKGVSFTALRYGNVYGPRQDPNGEAGVIAIFTGRIIRGEPIRIGTSVNALHSAIAAAVGRDVDVVHAPKRPGDVRTCVFAIDKARERLGWEPQTALADGIAKTTVYFKSATAAS